MPRSERRKRGADELPAGDRQAVISGAHANVLHGRDVTSPHLVIMPVSMYSMVSTESEFQSMFDSDGGIVGK